MYFTIHISVIHMSQFYDSKVDDIEFIPFDIETTGFKAAEGDFVTTVILYHSGMYHIHINTDGRRVGASEIEEQVLDGSEIDNILIHVSSSETEMLNNIGDYLATHTGNDAMLTAFNGETFKGNTDFDVPFLRTRCFRAGVEWILDGLWYADIYEVFSGKSRFDTTIKAEPSLDDMNKADLKQFVDDMGYEIQYERMLKDDIVDAINNHKSVSQDTLENWCENTEGIDVCSKPSDLKKTELKQFVDDMSVNISYEALSVEDIVTAIRECNYSEDTLVEWHEQTGRSIGNTEATTLDDIHEAIVEDIQSQDDWRRGIPFEIEHFTPFDPFEDSGEAVTAYKNGDFSGVILHCLADVARTVNLNRAMAEYVAKKDYKPKVL